MGRTLALIKPDIVGQAWTERVVEENEDGEQEEKVKVLAEDLADEVLRRIQEAGFKVVDKKMTRLSKAVARELYKRHGDKLFVETLTDFVSTGAVVAIVLEHDDAVDAWRNLIGPTDPADAREQAKTEHGDDRSKWSIRALFGSDIIANAVHGSSSSYNAQREINLLFPQPAVYQRTLAMIKPDVVAGGREDDVLEDVRKAGLVVVARQRFTLDRDRASAFYAEHQGKPFFDKLVDFMTSGPMEALVLEGDNAIVRWRLLMGPTGADAARAEAPNSIRAKFGTDNTKNAVHGSDSDASARREVQFWFPDPLPHQRTLAMIKPGTADSHADDILRDIARRGFNVVAQKRVRLSPARARAFYAEHDGKSFFDTLVNYMTSGPVLALVLAKPSAITAWRALCGPTNSLIAKKDAPHSLRARFGTNGTENAVHGSDSETSAAREISFFFPELQRPAGSADVAKETLQAYPAMEAPVKDGETPKLQDVLLDGLTELCRAKPTGLAAVEWLGRWLIENNPNQPGITAPRPLFRPGYSAAAGEGKAAEPLPNAGARATRGADKARRQSIVLIADEVSLDGSGEREARVLAAGLRLAQQRQGLEDILQLRALGKMVADAPGAEPIPADAADWTPQHYARVLHAALTSAGNGRYVVCGFPDTLDVMLAIEQAIDQASGSLECILVTESASDEHADVDSANMSDRQKMIDFYKKVGAIRRPRRVDAGYEMEATAETIAQCLMPEVIFVLGGPGSGKGTQCAKISETLGYTHLSSGDLLRAEVASGSALGDKLSGIMSAGQLVPMEVTLSLLRTAMARSGAARFLIDGFPRSVEQAAAFEDAVGPPRCVLNYVVPDDVLTARLLHRGKTSGRADDNAASIKKRLHTYHSQSVPVASLYRDSGLLRTIDASPAPATVFKASRAALQREVTFVLGGPGSGKGTQCAVLSAGGSFAHLSAGDLLRAEVQRGSAQGEMIDRTIREGGIVHVDVTLSLLRKAMQQSGAARFLIDGFPRALSQARAFEGQVGACSRVLFFDAPDAVLTERLLERGKTSGRADDNAASIKKRLKTFHGQSMPVIDSYSRQGKVVTIDANQELEEVAVATRKHMARKVLYLFGNNGLDMDALGRRVATALGYSHLSARALWQAAIARNTPLAQTMRGESKTFEGTSPEHVHTLLQEALAANPTARFVTTDVPAECVGKTVSHGLHVKATEAVAVARMDARKKADLAAGRIRSDPGPALALYQDAVMEEVELESILNDALAMQRNVLNRGEGYSVVSCSAVQSDDGEDVVVERIRAGMGAPTFLVAGATGSGRGTLASALSRKLNVAHIRVTELLKQEADLGTVQGQAIAKCMADGVTVPTHITVPLIVAAMQDSPLERFLLDGFPRIVSEGFPLVHDQIRDLEAAVGPSAIKVLLHLDASRECRIERAHGNMEAVDDATETFRREKLPVVRFFESAGKAYRINANVGPLEVEQQCTEVIQPFCVEASFEVSFTEEEEEGEGKE